MAVIPVFLRSKKPQYDRVMLLVCLCLLIIGLVLISSASVMEASKRYGDDLFLTRKHLISIGIAVFVGIIAAAVPTRVLKRYSMHLLLIIMLSLILVLIVGREINSAKRWISLGFFNIQPAEFLKLVWILYLSSYTSRKISEIKSLKGFLKPMGFVVIFGILLSMQPDFGSLVVVGSITLSILWVGGAGLLKYICTFTAMGLVGLFMVFYTPYRVRRVTSFLDPWVDPFGDGYQLTQSLMAFGRGGIYGEGLGNSIQKLGYLPEAHTDFVTAILGEEFGFVGMFVLIVLELVIVFKAVHLGFDMLKTAPFFQGYVAVGIGLWFFLQTFINIGAASGGLPTKGLTLPLISFGGSSLIVSCIAIGILLRIDFEWNNHLFGINNSFETKTN